MEGHDYKGVYQCKMCSQSIPLFSTSYTCFQWFCTNESLLELLRYQCTMCGKFTILSLFNIFVFSDRTNEEWYQKHKFQSSLLIWTWTVYSRKQTSQYLQDARQCLHQCTNLWDSASAPAGKGQPGCSGSPHLAARSAERRMKCINNRKTAKHYLYTILEESLILNTYCFLWENEPVCLTSLQLLCCGQVTQERPHNNLRCK